MTILIGISGKKQSGKDVVFQFIKELSVLPVYRIAFADAVKEEVAKATGITVEHIEQNKSDFRTILQWWGTDFRRKQQDNYWLEEWTRRSIKHTEECIIVAPDVRFPNEADYVTWLGGHLVRVNRPSDKTDTHISENALNEYRFPSTIENNSTLNNLRHDVSRLLHNLKIKQK